MRKLLMATVAVLGASLGIAQAAEISVVNPSLPTQPTPPASPATPALSAGFKQTPLAGLAPGQIVVRLELRENMYFVSGWSTTQSQAGDKMQPYGIIGYPRFYLGFDALATNGLQYGVFWEIRDNNSSGFGASGTAGNAGASGNSTGDTLFWRRDYLYMGTAQLGIMRFGQTDGPLSNMLTGVFDDIATGGWNGDINDWENGGSYGLSGSAPNWPFMDVGAEYTSAKVVYLSPKFFNMLDGAVSFEPSTANVTDGQNCNGATAGAGTGITTAGFVNCNNQSTSTAANDLQRRRNTLEVGLRFNNTYNGWGIAASAVGAYGGHVLPSANNPGVGGATFTNINGNTITLTPTTHFDDLKIGFGGVAVTFAGVTVGGSAIGGQYNGQMAALPANGVDSLAWMVGAEYNWGPYQLGATWYSWKYQGYWTLPGAQRDAGLEVGFTYSFAPGANFYTDNLYGQRYRGDFNFATGSPGYQNNNVHSNIFGAGFGFRW